VIAYKNIPAAALEDKTASQWPAFDINAAYQAAKPTDNRLVLVLDDDPTGIQTVHGVYVYMRWSAEILLHIFQNETLAFIQTNARSLVEADAIRVNQEIIGWAAEASQATGRDFVVISRSDSSLRGHYPAEPAAIRNMLEEAAHQTIDGEIICPFFPEAGRITFENVHYIRENDELVPVSQTEFAQDAVFGYQHSNLTRYVEEKTKGSVKANQVNVIPLQLLRQSDTRRIVERLQQVNDFGKVIINCSTYDELKCFVTALLQTERTGKRFVFRTAASFVKIYGYISDKPLLTSSELVPYMGNSSNSILTIVGSHTAKTNRQLNALLDQATIVPIEVDASQLLNDERVSQVVRQTVLACEKAMLYGHPVLFTSRQVVIVQSQDAEEKLIVSRRISECLASIVHQLSVRPKAMIVKGGITSSDIASKGMGIEKALILGQIRPSISVVISGEESRFPHMPYIIFPGNTGQEDDLKNIWKELSNN
jgi:uncharacterized protein YgbK (DUF1537 family)